MEKIDRSIEVMEGRDSRGTKMELNRRKLDEIVEWINIWERLQEEKIKGQIPLIPRSSTIKLKGI